MEYEEKKKIPKEAVLIWNTTPAPPKKPKVMNHKKLTDIQLKNRQANVRGNVTKTKNLLQYQKTTKQKEKQPLPDGPKRKKYEEKLKKLTFELDEIIKEISKRM